MSEREFGICTVKNNAFAAGVMPIAPQLPLDYEGEFAVPRSRIMCCVVIRHRERMPRVCGSLHIGGKAPKLCCHAHRKHESAAKAWAAGDV